ncbi:OmpA family protein, partial [Candidatus Aerophobetes bacterium]|nr:OmpA family protein [Candidatus Aerophobetes bacterium]
MEEEKPKSNFLLLYANLMMLLMTFFIVLVSLGRIEEEKIKIGMYSFREAFFSGGAGILFGKKKPIDFNYLIEQERIKLQRKISSSLEKALKKEKDMVKIVPLREGVSLRLPGRVLFDLGKAELKPEAKKILDKVVPVLKNYQYSVRVEGHTDNLPIHTQRFPSNW